MMKFLTFLLLIFIGTSPIFAQQIVDKKSFDDAVKTLQEETSVPLRLPTYFFVPSYLTAKGKKRSLKVFIAEPKPDSFAVYFCYSGICHGSFYYGEVSGEKITPETEKPFFNETVKLAQGITGYYQEGSCGSSCGNAWMFWEQDGYFYSVSMSVYDIEILTKVANSAINNNSLIIERTIKGGALNGKTTFLPKPVYPAKAKAANVRSMVSVLILVNKQGNVNQAKAVSGNKLFYASAETAARQAKFEPTILNGNPVQVEGVLVFNFAP